MTDDPKPPESSDEPDVEALADEVAAEEAEEVERASAEAPGEAEVASAGEPGEAEVASAGEPGEAEVASAGEPGEAEVASAEAPGEAEGVAAEEDDLAEPAPAEEEADEEDEADAGAPVGRPVPAAAERGPSKVALIAVALVALLAGAGTAYALSNRGGGCPAKGDAIKVEGTKVSNAEFQRRLELLRALYDVRPPTEPDKLATFRGDAAKGMAVAILVAQDVGERKLGVADKVVRDRLDGFIAQRYPEGGRAQFIQALGSYGVSEDDVLAEFRRILETQALFKAVVADVSVSEEQISKAFEDRKAQLAVPEKRQLRHLVVKTEDEAKQALARINGPETFEGVAKEVSLDTSTKDKGGELGTVSKAQLDPGFGGAAFGAASGATFGPVQTKNGWHVGLVEQVTPGHPVTLEEVHDSLKDTLVAEASLTKWRGYLGDRIRSADACYAKGNRPADPKAPPPELTTPTTTP
jgi:peptidyl-prolyl cis-trans isomerase C